MKPMIVVVFLCRLQARNWIRELRRMLGDNIVVCIVGNKMDLEKNRTVSQRDAERSVGHPLLLGIDLILLFV